MRGDMMGKHDEKEIKQLRAKVRELELLTSTQTKLIEILKSMPGCQGVKLKDEKTKRVPARAQKRGGDMAEDGSKRESGDIGKNAGGHNENSSSVEKQLQ
jgi:hypothetical protein